MKKLLCLLLVAVMAIGLVACGKLTVDDMVGKYDFQSMRVDGVIYKKSDIDQLNGAFEFEIKKDGYAYFTMGEDTDKIKVDVDNKTMKIDDEVYKFTYKDGNLNMTKGKDYMKMKKMK